MADDVTAIYADFGELLSGFMFEVDSDLVFTRAAGPVPHGMAGSAAEMIGRSLYEVGEYMTDLQARHVLARKLRRGEAMAELRYHAASPDGVPGSYELGLTPMTAGAAFSGYRGIIRDVTAAERTEVDLIAARQNAELANQAKADFLTNISHELRTPLNAIIGFSEVIQREMFGPLGDHRYREYIADVLESGRHLLNVINDMLDISRLETHQKPLFEDEVDVAEVVTSCLDVIDAHRWDGEISLEKAIPEALPPLWADSHALRQMIMHVLSNAWKFTPAGGAVTVSAGRDDAGGLTVSVADTGVGIAKEHRDHVLVPFGQSERGFARRHAGTGLGLPITKALMDLHDGELRLDSTLGTGTRVDLVFPRARVLDRPGRVALTGRDAG